ncbi:TraB/GumN family protein [Neisseriaceae bacterium CLB008]
MKQLSIWLCLGWLFVSAWAQAQSSVWRVHKDGKAVIVAGSIHALKPTQLPLPLEYDRALAAADRVVFEVDIEAANQPEAAEYLLQPFRLPPGVTLQQTLAPKVWAQWQAKLFKQQLPQQFFSEFDAAMASVLLPLTVLNQAGYTDGIDQILYARAKQAGKTMATLEDMAVQRQALQTLQAIDGNVLIQNMLADLENPDKDISILVDAVYAGDTETLAPFLADLKQPVFAAFYDALLTARNRAWVPQIEAWMGEEKQSTLVVVGALHLVGPDSVLAMLAAKGYQVDYYQ